MHHRIRIIPFVAIGLASALGGTACGQTSIGGTISSSTTLTAAQSPYTITSTLTVTSGATLTIEPGVTLRANGNVEVALSNGSLDAQGTAAAPILFTSSAAAPAEGAWRGIRFGSANPLGSVLRHAVIEFAGQSNAPGIAADGAAALTLDHVTVRNSLQDALRLQGNAAPAATLVTLENSGRHGIFINGGAAAGLDQLAVTNPGNYGIMIASSGNGLSLTNSVVANGVRFPASNSFAMQISGNTISDYHAFPARMAPAMVGPFLGSNTLQGVVAGSSELEVLSGTVPASATWPEVGVVYRMTGLVTVQAAAGAPAPVLTILAGARLRFNASVGFDIGNGSANPGGLVAVGTAAAPIVFTTSAAVPAPGQWRGLRFLGAVAGTRLERAIVEYAGSLAPIAAVDAGASSLAVVDSTVRQNGSVGLQATQSEVTVTGSTISANGGIGVRLVSGLGGSGNIFQNNILDGNGSYPIQIGMDAFPALGGNTFTGNAIQAVELTGTVMTRSFTLVDEGLPYVHASGLTVVGTGVPVMTVEAGVELRSGVSGLVLGGASGPAVLRALGTASSPVLFTTNAASPAPGAWRGISFTSTTGESVLRHAIVEFAGNLGFANVTVSSSSPAIDRCAIRNGSNAGVRIAGGTPVVSGCTITGNATGVATSGSSPGGLVVNNDIAGNGAGLAGPTGTGFSFDARGNWWGAAAGPSGIGPGGGDSVSGIVGFEPWLDQPRTLAPGWTRVLVSPEAIPAGAGNILFSGAFDEAVDWTLTVRNAASAVVRTFSGGGAAFSQGWSGDDSGGQPLPAGVYTFGITGTSTGSSLPVAGAAGDVLLSAAAPVAVISAPAANENIQSHLTYTVLGTAGGPYTLQLGQGTSPATFLAIGSGAGPVTNGPLGSFSPQVFPPGPAVLRLTVGPTGSQTVLYRTFAIGYLTISGISRTPLSLDPGLGGTVTIDYTLGSFADSVVFDFYTYPGQAPVTTRSVSAVPAGPQAIVWDGFAGGVPVAPGAYYFTILATNATGHSGSFNSATNPLLDTVNTGWGTPTVTGTSGFDPWRNDVVSLSFTLVEPMLGSLHVKDNSFSGPGGTFRDVTLQKLFVPGTHTEIWDGRRNDGAMYQGNFFFYWGIPDPIPLHGIVVQRPVPAIAGFRAQAYVIQNGFREVSTFKYDLTRAASVTITIVDPNGGMVRTLVSGLAQPQGPQSVEWDGRNDAGEFVAVEGDYRVNVLAVDAVTGTTASRTGTVVVYR